jgi:hypothetical protein
VTEFAKEVSQFLRDGEIEAESFLRELARWHPGLSLRSLGKKGTNSRS